MNPLEVELEEDQAALPPLPAITKARLENISITLMDGRTFNLGRPGTLRFRYRLWRFKKALGRG